jgi:site-specific DNA-methyltransferase (adenine-specific)
MDRQAGESKSTKGKPRKSKQAGDGYGMTHTGAEYADSGGPSRFFTNFKYQAKPNRKERDAGLDHVEPSTGGEATGRKDDSAGTKNPRAGAGRTGGARNTHPTVKAAALMKWLITLITPPGGLVLDPFCGSGSTGIAAVKGGWRFIGVERDEKYAYLAVSRIEHVL